MRSPPRQCADCAHQWLHTSKAGIVHRFCRNPRVLETMERKHVACVVAWEDVCRGRMGRGR